MAWQSNGPSVHLPSRGSYCVGISRSPPYTMDQCSRCSMLFCALLNLEGGQDQSYKKYFNYSYYYEQITIIVNNLIVIITIITIIIVILFIIITAM